MEIVLIANYEPDRQPSMQRFARQMEEGLKAGGLRVRVIRPPVVINRFPQASPFLQKWLGYIDKFVLFPIQLQRLAKQASSSQTRVVFHICDHSNALYVGALRAVPHVVTCHDVLAIRAAHGEVPEQPTGLTGRILQTMISQALRRAALVACVSAATQRELIRTVRVSASHVAMVHLHFDSLIFRAGTTAAGPSRVWRDVLEPRGLNAGFDRYLLHVGGDAWYKNRRGVIRIFRELVERSGSALGLIVVGSPLSSSQGALFGDGSWSRVLCVQDLDDADLAVLYRGADALLFPSLDEGFGYPVLEANACGCIAVISSRGSLPEVGGDAACYIDPYDEPAAARALHSVINKSPHERKQAREKALRNAARFSQHATINGYLALYERAMGAEPAGD